MHLPISIEHPGNHPIYAQDSSESRIHQTGDEHARHGLRQILQELLVSALRTVELVGLFGLLGLCCSRIHVRVCDLGLLSIAANHAALELSQKRDNSQC